MTNHLLPDRLLPVHPGEILLEEFMKPMHLTACRLASDIDVPPSRISDILHGRRPVTVDTALRLGAFFGMSPEFWLNLQKDYELEDASLSFRQEIEPRIRALRKAA